VTVPTKLLLDFNATKSKIERPSLVAINLADPTALFATTKPPVSLFKALRVFWNTGGDDGAGGVGGVTGSGGDGVTGSGVGGETGSGVG